MKNIRYIVMLAVMAVMTSLTSCMDDNNDWGVDPSANGNRTWAPLELKAEGGEDFIKIFSFKATNATSYEAQVSKVDFVSATDEDIKKYNFTRDDMDQQLHDTMTLRGLEPKTPYYVRVKAKANGKEDSQWVEYISSKGAKTVKTEAPAIAASKVLFDTDYAAGTVPAYFHDKAMTLYLVDTNGKMVVDGNTKEFSDGQKFTKRLKSGAKSSDASKLIISVSVNGKLTIYPYAGSSDAAKVSNLIVTQNGEELLNVAKLTGSGNGEAYVIEGVKAGLVEIAYPTNSVNFYGFTYEMDDDQEYVEDEIKDITDKGEGDGDGDEGDGDKGDGDKGDGTPSFIQFTSTDLPMSWSDGVLALSAISTDGKMSIDANSKKADGLEFTHRLKTGAGSSAANSLTLSVSKSGTLTIYAMSSSSSATRTLQLLQGETSVLNVEVNGSALQTFTANVTAGTINFVYSGGTNFYGFKFVEAAK